MSNVILGIILFIFAAPILIPIAISMFSVVLSVSLAFISAGFGFLAISLGSIIGAGIGIVAIGYGIGMIFANIIMAVGLIGQGLIAVGMGIIFTYIFWKAGIFTLKWTFIITGKVFKAFGYVIGGFFNALRGKHTYNAA